MSKLIERAKGQMCSYNKISHKTSLDLITLIQRYESALKSIAVQPDFLRKKIALEALGDNND